MQWHSWRIHSSREMIWGFSMAMFVYRRGIYMAVQTLNVMSYWLYSPASRTIHGFHRHWKIEHGQLMNWASLDVLPIANGCLYWFLRWKQKPQHKNSPYFLQHELDATCSNDPRSTGHNPFTRRTVGSCSSCAAMVPGWLWQAANQCGKISYTSSII